MMDNPKIIMNTFSPMKLLKNASTEKTTISVKHKLICPIADKNPLFSFCSFMIFCIDVCMDVSYTFSKLSLNVLFNDIVTLLFANKNTPVIIPFIIVTKRFAFNISLSEYLPIKATVITCTINDRIIIEENNEKSCNTMYKYNGKNCLSIIWLVLKAYIILYLLLLFKI